MISKALIWVLEHQTEEGSFYDVSWFPDRKVNSSIHRSILYGNNRVQRFSNISLTAQVLITLTNAKDLSGVNYNIFVLYILYTVNKIIYLLMKFNFILGIGFKNSPR